jgi:hypothetical protein
MREENFANWPGTLDEETTVVSETEDLTAAGGEQASLP